MTDLCTWAYDLAVSWLPPVPSFLWGEAEEEERAPEAAPTEDSGTAPGTTEALARARDALHRIETNGGEPARDDAIDVRLRAGAASLLGGGGGIPRLAGRLDEIDVARLAQNDRRALMDAASNLVERLRQS